MFYNAQENKHIHEGQQFTLDGVTYPSNWLNQSTPEQKAAIGLVEVVKTNEPADRELFWVDEVLSGATISYVNTPKSAEILAQQASNTARNKILELEALQARPLREIALGNTTTAVTKLQELEAAIAVERLKILPPVSGGVI